MVNDTQGFKGHMNCQAPHQLGADTTPAQQITFPPTLGIHKGASKDESLTAIGFQLLEGFFLIGFTDLIVPSGYLT